MGNWVFDEKTGGEPLISVLSSLEVYKYKVNKNINVISLGKHFFTLRIPYGNFSMKC